MIHATETGIVERVARAIYGSQGYPSWEALSPEHRKPFREMARAAIAAMPDSTQLLQTMVGASQALVSRIDRLAEGRCGPFDIQNCIANSAEMDELRAALAQFRAQEQPK